jgi:hypothetical protein
MATQCKHSGPQVLSVAKFSGPSCPRAIELMTTNTFCSARQMDGPTSRSEILIQRATPSQPPSHLLRQVESSKGVPVQILAKALCLSPEDVNIEQPLHAYEGTFCSPQ